MSVRTVITRLLPGDGTEVIIECRNCGTTVERETEECPDCGASEFVRYEIPE
jgi:rubrerythrin